MCDVRSATRASHRRTPRTFAHLRPDYLTACFKALPAANRGTRRFGMLIGAPVCGLRALRALRFAVLNVPNPTNDTESPFLNDFVMPSISESTAAAALVLVMPVSLAILTITSCLFMKPPCRSTVAPSALRRQGVGKRRARTRGSEDRRRTLREKRAAVIPVSAARVQSQRRGASSQLPKFFSG